MRGGTVGQCGYRPFFRRVVVALAGNVSVYRYRGIRFSFACRGQFASRLSARRGQNAPCAVASTGGKARPRNLQGGKPCFFRSRIGIFCLHLFFFAHVDGAYLFDFARGGIGRRIRFSRKKSFTRGVEEKRIAISADRTAGYAVRFLRDDRYIVFALFDNEEFYGELAEEELLKGVESGGWAQPLRNLLPQI